MKKTLALALLFFAGLATLWWLEYARVLRPEERRARLNRILPELFDARLREIGHIEIARGDKVSAFERREGGRWQQLLPTNVAANPAVLDNLIQNLIDLSRSADVGTIAEPGQSYGLEPPSAVIRLSGIRSGGPEQGTDIHASLDVGKSRREVRFVRPTGEPGIETVDAKLLGTLDLPPADWREKALLPVPTFQIVGLSISGSGGSYEAGRNRAGLWTLRRPVAAPANAIKIESILAGLSSLRVVDGGDGYVADDVKDLGKFGLDKPNLTVEVRTAVASAKPIVLQFGKADPAKPDRIYAKKGDQDEVLLVNAKFLSEIPRNPRELRVGKVADFEPARIVKIGIDSPASWGKLVLNRNQSGWEQSEPRLERVEPSTIQALIGTLNGLESSELFDTAQNADPRMTPLSMTVQLWQQATPAPGSKSSADDPDLALTLELGRHDVLRKTVYGRLKGDSLVLAIPDTLLKVLPKNSYSFRDRTILSLNPGIIKKLIVRREGQTYELAPAASPAPVNQWKMIAPAPGNVDLPTLSQIFASLSRLRVEEFAADASEALERQVGLDRPTIDVAWEAEGAPGQTSGGASKGGRLRIGARVPRSASSYAKLDGLPIIFTLDSATIGNFDSELRDHIVMSYPADRVFKVVMRWPNRTLTFNRKLDPKGGNPIWAAAPAADSAGIDASRINPLLSQAARLQTIKFAQYSGILPVMTGLVPPRLAIEIHLVGEPEPRVIRIGNVREEKLLYAATGSGNSGPVFYLPAAGWNNLVESGDPAIRFPDDVFAPAQAIAPSTSQGP